MVSPAPKTPHFKVLDGLRGVAAICVFVFHACAGQIGRNGFLGVDFFFLLSGFVIASAYGQKLSEIRLRFPDFMWKRIVRLWPMLCAGIALGLLAAIFHNFIHSSDRYSPGDLFEATALGVLLVPQPNVGSLGASTFPLDTVVWSLFLEVAANVVYAISARWMGMSLAASLALIGFAIVVLVGPLGGESIGNFWSGIPRVMFGFFGGVALYHAWRRDWARNWPRVGLLWLSVPILVVAFIPYAVGGLWFLLPSTVFGVVILAGAHSETGLVGPRACVIVGALSYPFYLFHRPILYLVGGVTKRLALLDWANSGTTFLAALAASLAASWFALKYYDEPLRAWLSGLRRHQ